jgi:hypothetical protein
MTSNCSLYPLEPLHPAVDPAYSDGIPPRPRRRDRRSGEMPTDWPVARIPERLERLRTISIEALEDAIERQAARDEALGAWPPP